jgi:tetratricopeptide (TPR) repeat protein
MRKYEEADDYLDRSISLDPNQVFGYLARAANYWYWRGDEEKARVTLEAMPQKTGPNAVQTLFIQEILERDYTAALYRLSSTSIETFEGGNEYVPKSLYEGLVYRLMGKADLARASYDEARVVLEDLLKELPDDARVHGSLGVAYAGLGRKNEAIREGKLAVELYPISKDALGGPLHVMDLIYIYVTVGEMDAAMNQIEYLISIPNGTLSVPFLRLDPQFDPLRSHPRFQLLLEEHSVAGS